MRLLAKNKQSMFYAFQADFSIPVYELDANGNPMVAYTDDEGNVYYVETGERRFPYLEPVSFKGNISMSGGEAEATEYGINLSDYSAVLVLDKDFIKFDEKTRIWLETKPVYGSDGYVDEFSADYFVVKVVPSLNVNKYLLQKVVK